MAVYKITEFFKGGIILKLYITEKRKHFGKNIYRFCDMFGGTHDTDICVMMERIHELQLWQLHMQL
jgi:hypothetical protein